jgi:hypothetical protein
MTKILKAISAYLDKQGIEHRISSCYISINSAIIELPSRNIAIWHRPRSDTTLIAAQGHAITKIHTADPELLTKILKIIQHEHHTQSNKQPFNTAQH